MLLGPRFFSSSLPYSIELSPPSLWWLLASRRKYILSDSGWLLQKCLEYDYAVSHVTSLLTWCLPAAGCPPLGIYDLGNPVFSVQCLQLLLILGDPSAADTLYLIPQSVWNILRFLHAQKLRAVGFHCLSNIHNTLCFSSIPFIDILIANVICIGLFLFCCSFSLYFHSLSYV